MASWWWRLSVGVTAVLTLGCQSLLGLPRSAASGAQTASSVASVPISGHVSWPQELTSASLGPGLYHTMAQWAEIETMCTVSVIDPDATASINGVSENLGATIGTGVSNANGYFTFNVPDADLSTSSVYVLEAVKGLFDNAVDHNAARVRTFVQYQGPSAPVPWMGVYQGSILDINDGTTAVCVIWGLGQTGGPATGPQAAFLQTVVGGSNTDFTDPASCSIPMSAFSTVHDLVDTCVTQNIDPVAAIGVDNSGDYKQFVSPIPLIYQLAPNEAAAGAQIEIVGQHFRQPVASTSVAFDLYDTAHLTCSSPCVENTPVSVSADGTTAWVQVPPVAIATGNVAVITTDGTSDLVPFQWIPAINASASVF